MRSRLTKRVTHYEPTLYSGILGQRTLRARARAIPLVLTGAATVAELEELDRDFIGEMSGGSKGHMLRGMPRSVKRTLEFLRSNEQRRPKLVPTAQYYRDMKRVLRTVRQTLKPMGTAVLVVAKSHTFYIHKTKEILHTVDAAGAMADLGTQVGLDVDCIIDVPLQKSGGLNARPRSTDGYSEAVIVFRRAGETVRRRRHHTARLHAGALM